MDNINALLRELPSVDRLMREPLLEDLQLKLPRRVVLQSVQETIDAYRSYITSNASDQSLLPQTGDLHPANLAREALALAEKKAGMNLKPLVNATGIIIHTNLGRAPLSEQAVKALTDIAANYNNLELSLENGKRGSRQEHLESLLCEISGAEAAIALNNNAAAVFMALNALAGGLEVVVSRGQLVEIGGSFRIPEIMAASGAKLVEVGTTNKTYLRDYEAVVNDNTAAFLKVHTSNYHMVGFTAEVETSELAELARKHNLLLIEDLGSGVFLDLEKYGLPPEPRVQDSISAGADLVTFSGDKMLGGPQCGIIVGRENLIARIRKNQLARAMRVDKFTIAALEATMRLYLDEEKAIREIPVWRMLTAEPALLEKRAKTLVSRFAEIAGSANVSVVRGVSKVGGGALPTAELPTYLVVVKPMEGKAERVVEMLRLNNPPVILRLQHDMLLFDPRTVFEDQEDILVQALEKAYQD